MNVLEELTEFESQIDKSHVERRVHDWKRRVEELYRDILSWLPIGWTGSKQGHVKLYEELMERYDVEPQRLPLLKLRCGAAQATLEPRGLWIIGANGRVDLIRPSRHYLIVDRAENFARPNWQVASLLDRMTERPLDRQLLVEMLA